MKKKNLKNRNSSLVAELVCCLLGGCAFCSALLPALGQEVRMAECLLFMVVDVSVIFLLSRRWWITPALIAALALISFAVVRYFELWEPLTEYVRGFLEWYRAAFPYTLPYSENGSLFVVHLAFTFPVALLLYLYFRKLPFLPVWVLLSGALLFWMYRSGADNLLPVAAVLLIVCIVLLSRANAGSINRKLGLSEKIPTAAMQLTALVVAPVIVLFSFAMGPKENGVWQSKGLVNIIADLQDAMSFYGDGSSGSGSFNIGYSGLAPNGNALGGDIDPNNRTVMQVKTTTPILLAGAVYDGYDGVGWYDTGALGRFRFTSPLWRGRLREVFAIGKPSSNKTAELYAGVSKIAYLDVSMYVRFRAIFANGKPERLEMKNGDDANIYFNTQGELFVPEDPGYSLHYTLRTRAFDRDLEGFDEKMRSLVEIAADSKDTDYEDICLSCLPVSDTVEPFVAELVEEITSDCENPYDRALALESWLHENCTYTKTPGDPPEGRDFVSAFLESREGYCTYFASAMTVMARMAGLPARYVTGYGLKQADKRPETNAYTATNATAHAWTQIYFYGVGWVDFDSTGWEFYELVERDQPVPKEAEAVTAPVIPEIPEIPEPELPEPEPENPQEGLSDHGKKGSTGRIVLIIFLCYLAAFLIFMLVRFILLFFRVENFYTRISRRYLDRGDRVDACYRQILKQLRFLGLEMAPSDTISSFCARADETLGTGGERESLQAVCAPVLLYRFARRKPRDQDIRQMCDFYIAMESRLRKTLGVKKYIIHRMILGK